MKKNILLGLLLLTSVVTFAQTPVQRFDKVIVTTLINTNGVSATFGELDAVALESNSVTLGIAESRLVLMIHESLMELLIINLEFLFRVSRLTVMLGLQEL